MRTATRPLTIAVGTVSAIALAAPAFAAPHATPTSLNLRAGKAVVKAHNKDTFTATLTSKGKPVAGQALALQERTAPTTGHRTTWTDVTAPACTPAGCVTGSDGKVTFTVTPPLASHKNTQKDQYRAVYKKTSAYGGSHSQIVTVTVKKS